MPESRLVAGSSEAVSLISATNGVHQWQCPIHASSRSVVVKDATTSKHHVFVGDYEGWIHKVAFTTGAHLDKFEVGGHVWGLTYADNVLYATAGNSLQAHDLASGPLWTHPMGDIAWGNPVVSNGIVYAGSWDDKLYAIKLDGTPAWISTAYTYFAGEPTVVDGVVYVAGYGKAPQEPYLVALDGASGQVLWQAQAPEKETIVDPVAVGDGRVYAPTGWGARLCAFDKGTGAALWSVKTKGHPSTALFSEGRVYVSAEHGGNDGYLQAYDAATGELLWMSQTPTATPGDSVSRPAVDEGDVTNHVFVTSQDGYLHAFDRDTGALAWKTAIGDGWPIEPTWTGVGAPHVGGRRPRQYATVDPLALILPGYIYAKINLPNPPPVEVIVARLRKSVRPRGRGEAESLLSQLRPVGSFVESLQRAIQKRIGGT